jgi:hypothetical protein
MVVKWFVLTTLTRWMKENNTSEVIDNQIG